MELPENIRSANRNDLCRIAEIEVFNYRLNFYPIFRSDDFYFGELRVDSKIAEYEAGGLDGLYVYDDGAVKGFLRMEAGEIRKLFVEPVLQGGGVGASLMRFAVDRGANRLWALEKNVRAIAFYGRHGFFPNGERVAEEDTDEYLIRLVRREEN